MYRRMRNEQTLEAEIIAAFMETHGVTLEEYSFQELMYDYKEDFLEYREWYMTCYS